MNSTYARLLRVPQTILDAILSYWVVHYFHIVLCCIVVIAFSSDQGWQ